MLVYKAYIKSAPYFNTYSEMLDEKEHEILKHFVPKQTINVADKNKEILKNRKGKKEMKNY